MPASAPDLLHVTAPIAPDAVGAGEVQAAFSGVVAFERPPIVTDDVSMTSVTVTSMDCPSVFSSASVATTVAA